MNRILKPAPLLILLCACASAGATSFDCAKARSDSEKIICASPDLSREDDALAALFAKAKGAAQDGHAFKEEQRAAWNWRQKNCHDHACVAAWYTEREGALRYVARTGQQLGFSTPAGYKHALPSASETKPDDGIKHVDADEIYQDYHANEVAADLEYKGKLVHVSGIVSGINVNFTGQPYVKLAAGDPYSGIQLTFDKDMERRLAEIRRGERIVGQLCVGAGMIVDTPIMDCTAKTILATLGTKESTNTPAPSDTASVESNTVSIESGSCDTTSIASISHRLESQGKPILNSGSAVILANGIGLVSYSESDTVHDSKRGDQVKACRISTERNCPAGVKPSDDYILVNLRTSKFWIASTSEHSCFGQ